MDAVQEQEQDQEPNVEQPAAPAVLGFRIAETEAERIQRETSEACHLALRAGELLGRQFGHLPQSAFIKAYEAYGAGLFSRPPRTLDPDWVPGDEATLAATQGLHRLGTKVANNEPLDQP